MNLFGCKFSDNEGNRDRKNFDTLLWALVTVFQVSFLQTAPRNITLSIFDNIYIIFFIKL